jgi:hypothetical protein
VKRLAALALLVAPSLFAPAVFAVDIDPKLAAAVKSALPVCAEGSLRFEEMAVALPPRFKGAVARVESPDGHCNTAMAAVLSPAGNFFLGSPWPVGDAEGATLEEKLKNFAWRGMKQNMTATIDRTRTVDGLFPVTLTQVTEAGKLPLQGQIDPEGRTFFMGSFHPLVADIGSSRMKAFAPFLETSPSRGAKDARVTIVEFSDFQCPSCQRAAAYVEPILAKHAEKIRYVRYDLPLSGHAWAFPATMAGRAIYRQNPELFWTYKKQVYENQSSLNAMTFPDFARAFAQDHDLDLARFDADLAAEPIREQILRGAGAAFANHIRATPSYLVNGMLVDAGHEGSALAKYVEGLLGKS